MAGLVVSVARAHKMNCQQFKTLVWNVHGLNNPACRNVMSQVVQAASPSIVCLQETKMETITVDVVRHCLGNKFENFFYLPAVGTRGGILVAWDTSVVNLSNPHHTTYTLTALVKPSEGPQWWLTGVYGPQLDQEKLDFLQEQVDIRDLHAGPWMVVGDFNLLVNPEDKSNDRINRRMLARFRAKLNMLELKELYLNGRRYTWSNERARATLEKVDHVFCTPSWEDMYPKCCLTAIGTAISDHCPLLLDLHADLCMGKRFKFEAFWTKADGFMDTVANAWGSVPSEGNPYVVLDQKLKATAKSLKKWSDRWIGNVKLQIAIALEVILRLDKAMDNRELTEQERDLRKVLKRKLLGLSSLERSIARQRSRILYLKEGDGNTRLFHQSACHRQRRNMMSTLTNNTSIATGHDEIASMVDAYYTNLLGVPLERPYSINLDILQLPSLDNTQLEVEFTVNEVEG